MAMFNLQLWNSQTAYIVIATFWKLSEHLCVYHYNVKAVHISDFVWISKLSDKIHYLTS